MNKVNFEMKKAITLLLLISSISLSSQIILTATVGDTIPKLTDPDRFLSKDDQVVDSLTIGKTKYVFFLRGKKELRLQKSSSWSHECYSIKKVTAEQAISSKITTRQFSNGYYWEIDYTYESSQGDLKIKRGEKLIIKGGGACFIKLLDSPVLHEETFFNHVGSNGPSLRGDSTYFRINQNIQYSDRILTVSSVKHSSLGDNYIADSSFFPKGTYRLDQGEYTWHKTFWVNLEKFEKEIKSITQLEKDLKKYNDRDSLYYFMAANNLCNFGSYKSDRLDPKLLKFKVYNIDLFGDTAKEDVLMLENKNRLYYLYVFSHSDSGLYRVPGSILYNLIPSPGMGGDYASYLKLSFKKLDRDKNHEILFEVQYGYRRGFDRQLIIYKASIDELKHMTSITTASSDFGMYYFNKNEHQSNIKFDSLTSSIEVITSSQSINLTASPTEFNEITGGFDAHVNTSSLYTFENDTVKKEINLKSFVGDFYIADTSDFTKFESITKSYSKVDLQIFVSDKFFEKFELDFPDKHLFFSRQTDTKVEYIKISKFHLDGKQFRFFYEDNGIQKEWKGYLK